jgi:adenylate cyclase
VGLGDTFVTPFSAALRGVERQATVITNLLHGDGLRRRQSTAWLDLASMVLVGLGLGWLNRSCAWLGGSLLALGFAAGYTVANVLLLTQARLWLSLLFPLLTIVATHGAMTLYKFRTESRQKQLIRQAFQHYLHPAMVDEVAQHPETLHLGGEQKTLTVLFSDVRSFSTLSERLTPEALVALLNEYFTAMTDLVLTHNGMLDKYIGDAVMAIYGAPLAAPDHAYQACCTALRMLHTLQTTLRSGWQARALPVLDIRIGINTGPMVVGNMGSTVRFDYTVMGDEVNLGARLEGVNKIYGTRVIVSATTWEQVGDRLVTRELDIIRVQGKSHPTRIFEVMAFPPLAPPLAMLVQRFAEGLAAYRARLWDEAADCFRAALCLVPDDGPSQLYLERCEQFRCNPPPADWDGIYDMQSK